MIGKDWLLAAAGIVAVAGLARAPGQNAHVCECGAHPPEPPLDRAVAPYAGEPADLSPYSKFAAPYDLNYIHPNIYAGAGRDIPEPKNLTEVRIGFFGPIEHTPEATFGLRMLHGDLIGLRIEALLLLPSDLVLLVGQAWLAEGATVVPDHEHDEFAWWPADPAHWPSDADPWLGRVAALTGS